jgi:DNA-binding MarR family transcriptional regulator
MDLSAVRHSLGPRIRDGLVLLRIDAKDGRVNRVVLTAAGGAKFKHSKPDIDCFPSLFDAA